MGRHGQMGLSMHNTRKFTLVELLTVITIIAILMGILIPSLSMARTKARKAQCLANLKQMGFLTQLYVQDYKGFMPPISKDVFKFMMPYWKDAAETEKHGNVEVLNCPAAPFQSDDFVTKVTADRRLEYGVNAYDYDNLDGDGTDNHLPGIRGVYLSRIRDQFNVLHITDADPFKDPWDIGGANSGTRAWPLRSHDPERHKDYYNALYLDGHAVGEDAFQGNHESWAVPTKIEN
jgi:prepilin-type processing-associated H-X9-DG protein